MIIFSEIGSKNLTVASYINLFFNVINTRPERILFPYQRLNKYLVNVEQGTIYLPVIPRNMNISKLSNQLCKLVCSEDNMRVLYILFILTLCAFSSQKPFIFEDNVDICSYSPRKRNEIIKIRSDTYIVKFNQNEINYKLCGSFTNNDSCPAGTSACVKSVNTGAKITLGTHFELDENYNFNSTNGEICTESKNYSVVVSLQCSKYMKDNPYLVHIEEKCTYHVIMRDPRCFPKCTTYIDGKFIDLRDLGRSFSVNSNQMNFSVNLCEKNPACGVSDVNACEIKGDNKTPISLSSSISVSYIGEMNQLSFHGTTYKGENRKIDKKFEVILKCNWDKKDIKNEDLKYVIKKPQGKKYTFYLETSFGCIKKPVPCVVNNQFLIYNLSGLNNGQVWSTMGDRENSSSIYFLQVCSPVELAGTNTSCKSTYAQVCENRNGVDINRGSVFRHLEVDNDVVKATIESGMQCEEKPDFQYKTFINFYCDEHEQGPRYLKQKDCDTYFTWRTPHACPYYNVSSCSYLHEHYHRCSFRHGNKYYDLSELSKTQKSIKDGNKEFLINICGPVIHPEAPCMRDVSVAFKNLTEYNIKHKIISLGKFFQSMVEDNTLVLKYITGSYCDGTDYTSKIRFECSSLQEEPVIIKQEKCYYEFLWKTKYVCPIAEKEGTDKNNNCTYIDSFSKESIDLGGISKTSIQLNDGNKFNYTFNICQPDYTNCTYNGDDCQSKRIKRAVVETRPNFTTLEFTLPVGCDALNDLNKILFRIICDKVKNNDHIVMGDIRNCSLVIDLFTNFVCSLKYGRIGDLTQPKQKPVETGVCFTKSPFTNRKLNINNLTFKKVFFKEERCPLVTYNDTYSFIKLLYVTSDKCRSNFTKNLSYEVYLRCTNNKFVPVTNDECLEYDNYEELEYCNYFNLPSHYVMSRSSIIGLISGILIVLVITSIVIFMLVRKKRCRITRYGSLAVYQRDTEL